MWNSTPATSASAPLALPSAQLFGFGSFCANYLAGVVGQDLHLHCNEES